MSSSVLNRSKVHADLLAVFEAMIPPHIIIMLAAPLMIFSGFIFSQLIIQPSHLGSFGALCNRASQVWEGCRVCWDVLVWALARIGRELAAVLGARELEAEHNRVTIEEISQPQASQPPPPYDVSMYYMECAAVLIVALP